MLAPAFGGALPFTIVLPIRTIYCQHGPCRCTWPMPGNTGSLADGRHMTVIAVIAPVKAMRQGALSAGHLVRFCLLPDTGLE
jgi:hypothetical protein